MKNLRKRELLAVSLLILACVAIAAGQENKNRRGDGSGAPAESAKSAVPSKTEAQPNDEQANPPAESNKETARRARLERHRRNP